MATQTIPRIRPYNFHDRKPRRFRTSLWLLQLGGRVASYAPLRRLLEMPLTVIGFATADAAAVWWDPIVGLFSAGVLLVILELLISDPHPSEGGEM